LAELWSTLVPLALASTIVPVQIVITVLLLRAPAGRTTAVAWVAGMTATRLAQGVAFGWLVRPEDSGSSDEPALVVAVLLLVVGILLVVTAVRALLSDDDPDAPPPRWMAAFDSVRPGKAFLLGAGLIAVSAKFWVFTLSALGAIEAAEVSGSVAVATYVAFVLLAQSLVVAVVAVAIVVPRRSDMFLARVSDWLERYDRAIVVVVGLVFGTWFLFKALDGLSLW
jgi:hypothetical protein